MLQSPDVVERHLTAAKCLLAELEQRAESALLALGDDNGSGFFSALEERDHLLEELGNVVGALAHEWVRVGASGDADRALAQRELAAAAAAALESQAALVSRTAAERDRLAAALGAVDRQDIVAIQYSPMPAPRRPIVSVTG
jgi:hypothetical protein